MQHVQTTGSTALQGKGGMLFLRNAEATVVDSTDTFASSGTVGGSMYVEGLAGLHLFRRTTIKHSAAAEYGGFMAAKGTTVQLDRAHVENCTAVVGGGGMHLDTSAVTHDGCSFLDVHSAGSGGGLWMKSSRFVWHEGHEGDEEHAAVTTFAQSRSPVGSFATVHDQGNQLNHVDVRGSTSQPRHSLASSDSSDSSASSDSSDSSDSSNSTFTNATTALTALTALNALDSSMNRGSCLHLSPSSALIARRLTILATSSGSAVHARAASVLDLAQTVLAGTAKGSGLLVATEAVVRLTQLHVHHNNHSGVVVVEGHVNVTNSSFHHNEPTEYGGGAMYTVGAVVVVARSTFTDNIGRGTVGGGVLCADKSHCTFQECEFSNPVVVAEVAEGRRQPLSPLSAKGGAIAVDRSVGELQGCTFTHIVTTTGGAVSVQSQGTVRVEESLFHACGGSEGAALYMEDSNVVVQSSTL